MPHTEIFVCIRERVAIYSGAMHCDHGGELNDEPAPEPLECHGYGGNLGMPMNINRIK